MTAMIFSELPLVMIKFVTDDLGFRYALHGAIARGECPDYAHAERSTGKSVTAFWLPEHVAAVRAWRDTLLACADPLAAKGSNPMRT